MKWIRMMAAPGILLAGLVAADVDGAQPPNPQTTVEKYRTELKTAEQAVATAKAALAEAEKTLAEKSKAAEVAAGAKTAAESQRASRAAAVMAAEAQLAAARGSFERANRELALKELADAQTAVIRAEEEKAAAERACDQKSRAVKPAQDALAAARTAALKADEELAKAKAALGTASADTRSAVEKLANDKATAAKAAAEKLATAQANLDKAQTEKADAEKAIGQKEQAIRASMARSAAAQAAADNGLKPLTENTWDYAKARHLLYRAGFGGTPEEVARLQGLGPYRAVQSLVYYQRIPSPPELALAAHLPERQQPYERRLPASEQNVLNQRRQRQENEQIQALRVGWLRRIVESPRPLEEKLILFWHGHFASEYETVQNSWFMFNQLEMFREHAAGNFGALLQGLVHDAAMLRYLNNDTNYKGHPNENLAREIMELFAMGLDQGYTEADIREAARALTGHTYDPRTGQFKFIVNRHEEGNKTIFGKTGHHTGDDLVELILQQPHTARFIARKMFTFFAHESPDEATVDHLAAVLRANNYELAPMLQNLFLSEEFYSPKAMGTQIKSPVQLLAGALRELSIRDANYAQLAQNLRIMGQDLLQPPNVKGWEGGRTWINANRIFSRYNALAELLENAPRAQGQRGVDLLGGVLAGKQFQGPAELADYLIRCCLARPLAEPKRQALIQFLEGLPPLPEWESKRSEVNARLTAAVVLLMCSPEYQLT